MKRHLIRLICVLALAFNLPTLLGQVVPVIEEDVHHCTRHKIANMQRKVAAQSTLNEPSIIDLKYVSLKIEPLFDSNTLKAEGLYKFCLKSRTAGIQFDCSEGLVIEKIVLIQEEDSINLIFFQSNEQLHINLNEEYDEGKCLTLNICWNGIGAATGFGSVRVDRINGTPVAWTLSQPYGAKDWWPTKMELSDKLDSARIQIVTTFLPAGISASANGIYEAETDAWVHRYPVAPYLLYFSVGPYQVIRDTIATLENAQLLLESFAYPENVQLAQNAHTTVSQMIALFESLVGAYPFASEKYGHAEAAIPGGMEHQTCSLMGSYGFGLTAHELAHQWFGNKVTCANWQEIWLNEGLATFMTGVAHQYLAPDFWSIWKSGTRKSAALADSGSIFVEDTSDFRRIFNTRLSYQKAAMVLHELRYKIGEQAFWAGLRSFLTQPNLAFGFATTADIVTAFEANCTCDLKSYFENWIYGQGRPDYTITAEIDQNHKVNFILKQTPSHPSVTFFEQTPTIEFKLRSGLSITYRVPVTDHNPVQFLSLTLTEFAEIDSILFEPDDRIMYGNFQFQTLKSIGNSILAYPNPTQDQLYLVLPNDKVKVYRILNSVGKTIKTGQLTGNFIEQIDVTGIATGVYAIVCSKNEKNEGKLSTKFIKQ